MVKFIEMIKLGVKRYKRQRMNDVVQNYAQCAHDSAQLMLPLLVGVYSGCITHVINRTCADPKPLVGLLEAINACVEHYGPGIRDIVEAYEVEVADVSQYLQPQLAELANSFTRMRRDVNPT